MNGRGRGGFSRGRRGGPVGSAVRSIAGGIGLISESVSSHKENKRAQASQSDRSLAAEEEEDHGDPPPYTPGDVTESQWVLDETQSDLLEGEINDNSVPSSPQPEDGESVAAHFLRTHALAASYEGLRASSRLELPVIIAQRRPKTRARGFVRAYAPELANVGIDQTTWLDFLDTFDKSSRASPWLKAINLASMPGALAPIGIGMAINVAVALTVKVAMDVQNRQRFVDFQIREVSNQR